MIWLKINRIHLDIRYKVQLFYIKCVNCVCKKIGGSTYFTYSVVSSTIISVPHR
jgi:hypothetical protein